MQQGTAGDTFPQRGLSREMLRSSIESIESMQISYGDEGTENADSGPGCLSPHLSSTVSLLCVVGKLLNPALLSASVVPGSLERAVLSSGDGVALLLARVPVLNSGLMARPWKTDT